MSLYIFFPAKDKDEMGAVPIAAFETLLKWKDIQKMVWRWHPNQVQVNKLRDLFNTLTPKPPVTGHATSILVGRISAGCCSESGEKAVGRVVIKGTLGEI
ncbi:hypothetical protein AVEN_143686-1 [Araneus ventricosus]|uniref:Uncharacterized protein n=1 Tax=Araneus ventricosus TaxID=182803 RepID=A0A4Y2AQ72_ARAVE|nr:hypothetical protein AVEN_143686-1 [Araneus ventricosus]